MGPLLLVTVWANCILILIFSMNIGPSSVLLVATSDVKKYITISQMITCCVD